MTNAVESDLAVLPGHQDLIYRGFRRGYVVFYAPGYVVVAGSRRADAVAQALAHPYRQRDPIAAALLVHADAARAGRAELLRRPFQPVCLTVYPGSRCNLRCSYCYCANAAGRARTLDRSSVLAAVELVADTCAQRRHPLTVAFHGGGEPTLYPELINDTLTHVAKAASCRNLALHRYLATNGVMPTERARWVARTFDSVGLSCDGPEELQSRQRPTRAGQGTTARVERTADMLRAEGVPLSVRVTVTRRSLQQQPDIITYLCERLQPEAIWLEPVYAGGRATPRHVPDTADATAFVDAFLAARKVARGFGVPLRTSGTRPWELHGPYCNVLRDVLQLVTGGAAATCFLTADAEPALHPAARRAVPSIGQAPPDGDRFTLDHDAIDQARRTLARWPDGCARCFNRFHCAAGCPDRCPASPAAGPAGFRCHVAQELARRLIDEVAADAWRQAGDTDAVVGATVAPI